MKRVVAIACVVMTATAHAQPSEPERLYLLGQKAYNEQRYDDALLAWEKSYELSKLPGLLFNIAQAYRLRAAPGDCTLAITHYQQFLERDPQSNERGNAQSFIAELTPCAAAERGAATRAQPPTEPVAPVTPTPEGATGGGKRLIGYGLIGGGVVLAGVGAYFGVQARSLGDEVSEACARGCDWNTVADKDAEGRRYERNQWILYGVGGATIAAGVVFYYLGSRERAAPVTVAPVPGGAAISWSGSW